MEFINHSLFSAFAFQQLNAQGARDTTVAARGTFTIVPDSPLKTAPRQAPFQWADEYEDDPHTTPLLVPSDLAPFKPGTDVTLMGASHCPDPQGAPNWSCGLRIRNATGAVLLDKVLGVFGSRAWHRASISEGAGRVLVWRLTPPSPAHEVSLDWRLTAGGPIPDHDGSVHPDNPIGMGLMPADEAAPPDGVYPAPHTGSATQLLAGAAVPAGFGPLSPWWRPRQRYAGTYDDAWAAARHPLLPNDFDDRFWQCAPPDQVIIPWLRGTEQFTLVNVHPTYLRLSFTLPGIMLGVTVETPNSPAWRAALELDGVHFDLRDGRTSVTLTWRARLAVPDPATITLRERARVAEHTA